MTDHSNEIQCSIRAVAVPHCFSISCWSLDFANCSNAKNVLSMQVNYLVSRFYQNSKAVLNALHYTVLHVQAHLEIVTHQFGSTGWLCCFFSLPLSEVVWKKRVMLNQSHQPLFAVCPSIISVTMDRGGWKMNHSSIYQSTVFSFIWSYVRFYHTYDQCTRQYWHFTLLAWHSAAARRENINEHSIRMN